MLLTLFDIHTVTPLKEAWAASIFAVALVSLFAGFRLRSQGFIGAYFLAYAASPLRYRFPLVDTLLVLTGALAAVQAYGQNWRVMQGKQMILAPMGFMLLILGPATMASPAPYPQADPGAYFLHLFLALLSASMMLGIGLWCWRAHIVTSRTVTAWMLALWFAADVAAGLFTARGTAPEFVPWFSAGLAHSAVQLFLLVGMWNCARPKNSIAQSLA